MCGSLHEYWHPITFQAKPLTGPQHAKMTMFVPTGCQVKGMDLPVSGDAGLSQSLECAQFLKYRVAETRLRTIFEVQSC